MRSPAQKGIKGPGKPETPVAGLLGQLLVLAILPKGQHIEHAKPKTTTSTQSNSFELALL